MNDFQNPLQRTLSSLELPMAVSVANVSSPTLAASEFLSSAHQENDVSIKSSDNFQQNGRQRQKHHDPARDLSIQVLEKFSLVTRFARETTSQIFRDSHIDGFSINNGRKLDQSSPDHHLIATSDESEKVPVASDPLEATRNEYWIFTRMWWLKILYQPVC